MYKLEFEIARYLKVQAAKGKEEVGVKRRMRKRRWRHTGLLLLEHTRSFTLAGAPTWLYFSYSLRVPV